MFGSIARLPSAPRFSLTHPSRRSHAPVPLHAEEPPALAPGHEAHRAHPPHRIGAAPGPHRAAHPDPHRRERPRRDHGEVGHRHEPLVVLLVFLLAVAWLLGLTQKLPRARLESASAAVTRDDADGDGLRDSDEDALLARYVPRFVLDRDEPSLPASIPWLRDRIGISFDGPRLAGALVPKRRFDAETRKGAANPADRRVYGHAFRDAGGGIVLQYWNYYPYNEGPLFFDHESDWEHVSVRLTADGAPVEVAYARHEDNAPGKRVPWAQVSRDGQHPVVLVAAGTHASYPERSDAPWWERVPDCAREGSGAPDAAKCGAQLWAPSGDEIVNVGERAAPRLEREADAFFIRYAGLWGEPATVLGTAVPPGPPFQRGFCADADPLACR